MSASAAEITKPVIVGMGGTTRESSSSELALRASLAAAEAAGAVTTLLGAASIELPMYAPERPGRDPRAVTMVNAVHQADGLIIASPGYHGGFSGLVKNALDYLEDLRDATPAYLENRPVGLIVCAHGWQATTTTLMALRSVVHALRGWPTPLGVAINSAEPVFAPDGSIADERIRLQLELLGRQVASFASTRESAFAHAV